MMFLLRRSPSFSAHSYPVLSFCLCDPGKSYTMIGSDDSLQTLGIIPCAISWLFKLINERKEKTGARFSVRVSAVEVSDRTSVTSVQLLLHVTNESTHCLFSK